MATLSFAEARQQVLDRVQVPTSIPRETVWLSDAAGRVNATAIHSDRDMPPLPRSLRDGFALRSIDLPGPLQVTGEIRAGQLPTQPIHPGTTMAIMTGAVIPEGCDQVVMKEHVSASNSTLTSDRAALSGEWISPAGSMARQGDIVIPAGRRIDASAIAMLATIGQSQIQVNRQPVVRILATGDEVVDIARKPNETQVRNSNSWALATDVRRFGGRPEILPIAPDQEQITRDLIAYGLEADLLLISGGVSAGEYDFVEVALANLGASFFFDRVTIQPGQPTVFGQAKGTFFFGLPGNPLSTMVTFRIFAEAALSRLAGIETPDLLFHTATIQHSYKHKPGLTRFLPGLLSNHGQHVEILPWQGSGDIPALVRANCFVTVDARKEAWQAGDPIQVLLP
ncbi:MAG: molybdopterin molybdotransferase MoeA [Acidobacteria bacterium]|nr:molybdopterin molybdotransferase MoeA [Acidobacteriota bacterium]